MIPRAANRFNVLYTVAFETRAPELRNVARICSADRCCGAHRSSDAIRTRCPVGRIPHSERRAWHRAVTISDVRTLGSMLRIIGTVPQKLPTQWLYRGL